MFCVECGKDGPIYKNGVCIDCYLKTNSFTKGPSIIDITVCPQCSSIKFKNIWTSDLLGEVLRRVVKENFQISRELSNVDINPVCKESKEGADCKIYISGYIEKNEITEEHDLQIRFKKTSCEVCSRRFGGYHEAIIQVRAEERKLTKKEEKNIILLIENQVDYLQSKGNRGLFITDIEKEHGGLDFLISDKGAALLITKKIQIEYGGRIKQSSKNIGMKDSRQIHRITYLIKIPPYKKNDFVEFENDIYQILNMQASKVKMINLLNWKESIFNTKNLQKTKIIGGDEIIKEFILVSQNSKEIQIMHPKSYKISIVRKSKPINFDYEKIKAITYKEKIYLIPKI
jgi:nonsense-mediated mRNA decay protein 3